jgi:hypothetical protein
VAECQHELTIRQTRTTAARLALCAVAALVCWHFLWIDADAGTWRLVALPLAAVTMVGALHATGVLLVTGRLGRRLRGPTSLPTVTAWAASATAVAMVLTTVVLVAALAGATTVVPVALAAGTAVVGHAVVAASARRCRRCGRLGRP